MKKVIGALVALALACVAFASPVLGMEGVSPNENAPFSGDDIFRFTGSLTTVGDYVAAFSPASYGWVYEGDATGNTDLTMTGPTAMATLYISTPDGMIDGQQDAARQYEEPGTGLPPEILALPATLRALDYGEGFAALPSIRDIPIGATIQEVVFLFLYRGDAPVLYGFQDVYPEGNPDDFTAGRLIGGRIEEDAIHYGWADIEADWKTYYHLAYLLEDGKVARISFSGYTDGE